MASKQCEWCERWQKWRFFKGDYERFACDFHIGKVRHQIKLDLPFPATYEWEAVAVEDAS